MNAKVAWPPVHTIPWHPLPQFGLRRLAEKAAWIERYRQLGDARFEELDGVVEELKRKEKVRDAVDC